ncbi:unnamed protein product, partial [Mesorhabditis spiculigera]
MRELLFRLVFQILLLGAASRIVRQPEYSFTRGPLDYRSVLLDAESASLFVGARGRLFRLWAYNVNDTSEKLFTEKLLSVSPSELAECRAAGNSEEECENSVRKMFLRDAIFHHLLIDSRQEHNVVFAIDAPSSRLWRLAHWRDGSDWRLETIESASVLSTPCAIDPYCSWNVARAQCHPREKLHHQSPGWVSSWAGRGAPECKTVGRPVLTKAFPGDAVHLETQPGSVWLRDGVRIESGPRTVFTSESGLVLFDVAKKDNGDYEAMADGRQIVKYRLIVDHEDCEQPKTIESLKAAQRQYCKRMDGHKRAMAEWHSQKQQCPITQNVSGNPLR